MSRRQNLGYSCALTAWTSRPDRFDRPCIASILCLVGVTVAGERSGGADNFKLENLLLSDPVESVWLHAKWIEGQGLRIHCAHHAQRIQEIAVGRKHLVAGRGLDGVDRIPGRSGWLGEVGLGKLDHAPGPERVLVLGSLGWLECQWALPATFARLLRVERGVEGRDGRIHESQQPRHRSCSVERLHRCIDACPYRCACWAA